MIIFLLVFPLTTSGILLIMNVTSKSRKVLLKLDNTLEKRNTPNRCYLYKKEEETSYHLILCCKKVTMLWNLLFSLFSVQWVLYFSIKRNLIGWDGAFVSKRREKAWRAAIFCLMWTLWKKRNERVFNDIEWFNQVLKHSFLYTFVNWVRVY